MITVHAIGQFILCPIKNIPIRRSHFTENCKCSCEAYISMRRPVDGLTGRRRYISKKLQLKVSIERQTAKLLVWSMGEIHGHPQGWPWPRHLVAFASTSCRGTQTESHFKARDTNACGTRELEVYLYCFDRRRLRDTDVFGRKHARPVSPSAAPSTHFRVCRELRDTTRPVALNRQGCKQSDTSLS